MMCRAVVAKRGLETQVAESGLGHGTHIDTRLTTAVEGHGSRGVGIEHIGPYAVCHGLSCSRDSIMIEGDIHQGPLAGLIKPVGMVGLGNPEEIRAVGIIACHSDKCGKNCCKKR